MQIDQKEKIAKQTLGLDKGWKKSRNKGVN